MKKALFLIFTLVFVCSCLLATANSVSKQSLNNNSASVLSTRTPVAIYSTDFESANPLEGWTKSDLTAAGADECWHLSSTQAFGSNGQSWWMGKETLGGYYNHRYFVLDTPTITIPASNATLTFKLNYKVESTSGATAPYTGWDGCNVRISTNNGQTWTVLTPTAPAYNATALYSFGSEFGEGTAIAGWGGSSNGWIDASFNLASYAGQNVKIRFAMASDPAQCTEDDATLFGMKVDNIDVAGVFQSNGEGAAGDTQMTQSVLSTAGDYWTIINTDSHSTSHSAFFPLHPGVIDCLVSPSITIPQDAVNPRVKYWFKCDLLDADGDNDAQNLLEDYYILQIKRIVDPDTSKWLQVHYNYSVPELFPNGPAWTLYDQDYATTNFTTMTCDLSPYAGYAVKLRFEAKTDLNDDGGTGTGLYIDDFMVYQDIPLPGPESLVAVLANNDVSLTWHQPVQTEVLKYTNDVWIAYVNDGQPYAVKFTNNTTAPMHIKNVNFQMINTTGTVSGTAKVTVWQNNNNLPGDVVAEFPGITDIQQAKYTSVNIYSQNIIIPVGGSVFVGVSDFTTTNQGLRIDGTSTDCESFAFVQNAWTPLQTAYTDAKNIAITIDYEVNDPTALQPTGYKVFRSTTSGSGYAEVGSVTGVNTVTYVDATPAADSVNFYMVKAVYDLSGVNELSAPSNEASIFAISSTSNEYIQDDGTSEQAYVTNGAAGVKVTPYVHPSVGNCKLTHIKIYIAEKKTANLTLKVYPDVAGVPGETATISLNVPASRLAVGWNYIQIPIASQPIYTGGSFYIVCQMSQTTSHKIGLDTNTTGSSYVKPTNGTWSALTTGNLMIRVIVNQFTAADDNVNANKVLTARNFPNPFNPETTIQFNMPKAGKATVNIYNIKGQLVKTFVNNNAVAGANTIVWKGLDKKGQAVSSGMYFYKVETANQIVTNKMLLIK